MPQFFEHGSAEEKVKDVLGGAPRHVTGMGQKNSRSYSTKRLRHHLSIYYMSCISYLSKTPRSKSDDCETPKGPSFQASVSAQSC